MSKREQNERRFQHWESLPGGGRRYWYDRPGRMRGWARYVKVVDENEEIVSFVQEIYDELGNLIGRHQKYPEDGGHVVLGSEGSDV